MPQECPETGDIKTTRPTVVDERISTVTVRLLSSRYDTIQECTRQTDRMMDGRTELPYYRAGRCVWLYFFVNRMLVLVLV